MGKFRFGQPLNKTAVKVEPVIPMENKHIIEKHFIETPVINEKHEHHHTTYVTALKDNRGRKFSRLMRKHNKVKFNQLDLGMQKFNQIDLEIQKINQILDDYDNKINDLENAEPLIQEKVHEIHEIKEIKYFSDKRAILTALVLFLINLIIIFMK